MDLEFGDPPKSLERYFIGSQPLIHRIYSITLAVCGFACVANTSLGLLAFVVGLVMYAWSELPLIVARGVTAAFALAAIPTALFLIIFGLSVAYFLWAGLRIRFRKENKA